MADGELIIETKIETKSFDKQIQALEADLDRYMKVLESDAKIPISLRMSADERRQLEVTIEKIKNQLIDLKGKTEDVGDAGEEAGEKSSKSFEKGIKSLKRFGLSLFGIRSAFTLMSRASSAYLSQNEAAANKMQALWTALGNLVGPVIEIIANAILKLVGYLQVFVNALGWKIDLTKNMNKNTKAVQGTSKAMEELNKQTFDELNVLNDNSKNDAGGGISGGAGDFEMPELDPKIVKMLQDMAGWLKENWDWIWKVGAALAGVFGVAKIAGVLGGIGKLIGGGTGEGATGLLGLKNTLYALLALEVITITVSVITHIKQIKDLRNINNDLSKSYKKNTEENKRVNLQNLETAKSYEKGSDELNRYTNEIKNQNEWFKTQIESMKKRNKEGSIGQQIIDGMTGTTKANNEVIRENVKRLADNAAVYQELAKEGKLTDEQAKDYKETLKYLTEAQEGYGEIIEAQIRTSGLFKNTERDANVELYNQIEALKQNDKALATTTENEKTNISSLAKTFTEKFGIINNLKAEPKVEVKTDTKKLSTLFDTLNQIPLFGNTFSSVSKKLKAVGLAKGGIVNVPGKGVPIGNAYAGEAGREGILPLTDSQAMETLGQAIGKYISLNAIVPIYVGNRQVAREMKRIEAEDAFMSNS